MESTTSLAEAARKVRTRRALIVGTLGGLGVGHQRRRPACRSGSGSRGRSHPDGRRPTTRGEPIPCSLPAPKEGTRPSRSARTGKAPPFGPIPRRATQHYRSATTTTRARLDMRCEARSTKGFALIANSERGGGIVASSVLRPAITASGNGRAPAIHAFSHHGPAIEVFIS